MLLLWDVRSRQRYDRVHICEFRACIRFWHLSREEWPVGTVEPGADKDSTARANNSAGSLCNLRLAASCLLRIDCPPECPVFCVHLRSVTARDSHPDSACLARSFCESILRIPALSCYVRPVEPPLPRLWFASTAGSRLKAPKANNPRNITRRSAYVSLKFSKRRPELRPGSIEAIDRTQVSMWDCHSLDPGSKSDQSDECPGQGAFLQPRALLRPFRRNGLTPP